MIRPERLERALDTCLSRGRVDIVARRSVLDELSGRGRPGVGVMRRLLAERGVGPAAESELDRRLLGILAEVGLPAPRRQVHAGGADLAGRVDFTYGKERLVIEADSRRHHMSKLDFENDRQRDNMLMADGWRVLRITWHQVTERPNEVARIVRHALNNAA